MVFSQGWEQLTPLKVTNNLFCAKVIDDTTAYIGGDNPTLLKTSSHGEVWSQKINYGGTFPLSAVAINGIDFINVQTGFIATNGGEIYRTTNGGANWVEVYNSTYAFMGLCFVSPTVGIAITSNGQTLRTTDSGTSWTLVSSGVTSALRDIKFVSNLIGYMVTDNGGVLKTTNAGITWNLLTTGSTAALFGIDCSNDTCIAAGVGGVVIRSIDGGMTWSNVTVPTTAFLTGVDFVNATTVYITGYNGVLLRSTDAGASFSTITISTSADLYGVMSFPSGRLCVYGQSRLLESNDNGLSWSTRHEGTYSTRFKRIAFVNDSVGIAIGSSGAVGSSGSVIARTTDNGRYWTRKLGNTSSQVVTDLSMVNDTLGYASGIGGIRKTIDAGNTWTMIPSSQGFTALHFMNETTGVIASGTNGIMRTINGGVTWTTTQSISSPVNRFSFVDDLNGLAVTDFGYVLKTTDGGISWTQQQINSFDLYDVQFVNDTTAYLIGDFSVVYKSINGGTTWFTTSMFITQPRALLFPDPGNPDSGYVMSWTGTVAKTTDGGLSSTFIINPNVQEYYYNLYGFTIHQNYFYLGGERGNIYKYRLDCTPTYATQNITSCDNFIAPDGQVISSSGAYTYIVENAAYCDSIITLNYTLTAPDVTNVSLVSCDNYFWAASGQTLTNSGIYSTTVANMFGCDSTINLDLTIVSSSAGPSQNAAECESYIWPVNGQTYTSSGNYTGNLVNSNGCDSTVSLNLVILNPSSSIDVQTTCEPYIWIDGNTYSTSNNTATYTLLNSVGCDSIVTLDLTINSPNVSITQLNNTTLSVSSGGTSYQWLDCNNGFAPIAGETSNLFSTAIPGSYAVLVTQNGCSDTSTCFALNNTGLNENYFSELKITPNPTMGEVLISFPKNILSAELTVTDATGRIVRNQILISEEMTISLQNEPSGIYFFAFTFPEGKVVREVVRR